MSPTTLRKMIARTALTQTQAAYALGLRGPNAARSLRRVLAGERPGSYLLSLRVAEAQEALEAAA